MENNKLRPTLSNRPKLNKSAVITVGMQISETALSLAAFEETSASHKFLESSVLPIRVLMDAQEGIEQFLHKWSAYKTKLVFCVPRRMVLPRFLELPSVQTNELQSMAEFQALNGLPFPEDDLISDTVVLNKNVKEGISNVFLAIVRKSQMEPYLTLFQKVGRYPDAFVLSPFALQRYLKEEKRIDLLHYLHLHVQDNWIELNLFHNGQLVSTRAVPVRKNDMWDDRIVSECRQSLNIKNGSSEPIQCIVLSGEEELEQPDLKKRLETELQVSLEEIDSGIDPNPLLTGGCAVSPDYYLNLLPKELKEVQKSRKQRRELQLAGLWLGLWALSFVLTAGWSAAGKRAEISQLDSQIKVLEPDARKVSDIMEKAAFLREQMNFSASPLEVVREIHEIVPQEVILSSLFYDADGRLIVQGTASRYSQVMDLINRLERSSLFSKAELRTSNSRKVQDKDMVDFQAQCLIERLQ